MTLEQAIELALHGARLKVRFASRIFCSVTLTTLQVDRTVN